MLSIIYKLLAQTLWQDRSLEVTTITFSSTGRNTKWPNQEDVESRMMDLPSQVDKRISINLKRSEFIFKNC